MNKEKASRRSNDARAALNKVTLFFPSHSASLSFATMSRSRRLNTMQRILPKSLPFRSVASWFCSVSRQALLLQCSGLHLPVQHPQQGPLDSHPHDRESLSEEKVTTNKTNANLRTFLELGKVSALNIPSAMAHK